MTRPSDDTSLSDPGKIVRLSGRANGDRIGAAEPRQDNGGVVLGKGGEFGKPLVLLVEHDEVLRLALKSYLETRGVRVVACDTLPSATKSRRYSWVVIGDESAHDVAEFAETPGGLHAIPAMRFILDRQPENLPVIVISDNARLIMALNDGLMGTPRLPAAYGLPREDFERGREVKNMTGETLLATALERLSLGGKACGVSTGATR